MKKSEVIYSGRHYSASYMQDSSLIVQSNKTGKGKRILPPEGEHWAEELKMSLDDAEREAICRAILSP